jgi:hypothetical protein
MAATSKRKKDLNPTSPPDLDLVAASEALIGFCFCQWAWAWPTDNGPGLW